MSEEKDPSQAWFWEESWLVGEKRASADIAAGRLSGPFSSADEMFDDLDRHLVIEVHREPDHWWAQVAGAFATSDTWSGLHGDIAEKLADAVLAAPEAFPSPGKAEVWPVRVHLTEPGLLVSLADYERIVEALEPTEARYPDVADLDACTGPNAVYVSMTVTAQHAADALRTALCATQSVIVAAVGARPGEQRAGLLRRLAGLQETV